MSEEILKPRREKVNGEWHSLHVSADGLITVDTGRDDQRPDADGVSFFQPICVAEVPSWSKEPWNYHDYCGKCRKRIGSLGEVKEFCSRCGAGIAHYTFDMGVLAYQKSEGADYGMPDVLPPSLPALKDA